METVASSKTAALRLAKLEQHLAMVTARYREEIANARVYMEVAKRRVPAKVVREIMQSTRVQAWESALFWLAEGHPTQIRTRIADWAALDFGPALDRYIAHRRRWLDPERDYDYEPGEIENIRADLAAAVELRAERDRAEAEALAAS